MTVALLSGTIDGNESGVMLCLIDWQLTGQDPPDFTELRQRKTVSLELSAHGLIRRV